MTLGAVFNELRGPVLQIGGSLFVAIFAAWFAVRLALHRFYQERWWERKYEAYTQAIGALADLHYELLREVARTEGAKHIPELDMDRLQAPIKAVHRASAFGALLLSSEMRALLHGLGPRLNAMGTDITKSAAIAEEALGRANDIAARDLDKKR